VMERPILFQGAMIQALLDGRKTQTRRPVSHHVCPYGEPGDRLYVREAHALLEARCWPDLPHRKKPGETEFCFYREGFDRSPIRWRPSIHMPRWAARIFLEIVASRVERLDQITEEDAHAEGAAGVCAYRKLWDKIYGKALPWVSAPWVWVLTFKVFLVDESMAPSKDLPF
jgi:hypothetical protein